MENSLKSPGEPRLSLGRRIWSEAFLGGLHHRKQEHPALIAKELFRHLREDFTRAIGFYVQLGNENVLRQIYGIRQLTQAFLEDLKEYIGKRRIIFLFDEIGSDPKGNAFLDRQTRRWLIEDFIIPLCDDLPSARFVVTQRDELEPQLQTLLFDLVIRHVLTEF